MTRKVAQNTRPSFSYMREGLGMRLAHLIFLCVEEPGYEATCFRSGNETMIIPFLLAERQIMVLLNHSNDTDDLNLLYASSQ